MNESFIEPFTLGAHSIYRVRFTFSNNGVVFSRVALVCSHGPYHAKERICHWVLSTFGPLPDFNIKSVTRFNECSYIIPNHPQMSFCRDSDDKPFAIMHSGESTVRLSQQEVISQIGEFVEADEILNLFNS